tara:strand:+ start:10618 stop:12027 length:1410 start_codon:yes stop_codon:yes gene_type:complete
MKLLLKDWLEFKLPLHEIIMNASIKNGGDSLMDFMIGVSISCNINHIVELHNSSFKNNSNINNKLYCLSFATNTDLRRRGKWSKKEQKIRRETIMNTLNKNNYKKTSNGGNFFKDLLQSKFTFCPEGNGIDTHRHYEALIFKSIPIVEDNPKIMNKYEGLPVLYTHDYSEINDEYLNKKYDEMLNTEYDFSKLFMSNYTPDIQKVIKDNGNFWVKKCKNITKQDKYWPLDLSKVKGCENIYKEMSFLTVTNSGYKDVTFNCIKSLNRMDFIHNINVFCMDTDCFKEFDISNNATLIDVNLNTRSNYKDKFWNNVTMKKIDIVRRQMEKYKYVLHTDGDIVYEDPFFYIDSYLQIVNNDNKDIICQVNHPYNKICSGFYVIRSTEKTRHLYDKDTLIENKAYDNNDEEYLCKLAEEKKIIVKFFDREFYPNGNIIFYRGMKNKPFIMHFNYLDNYLTKVSRLKKLNKWYI